MTSDFILHSVTSPRHASRQLESAIRAEVWRRVQRRRFIAKTAARENKGRRGSADAPRSWLHSDYDARRLQSQRQTCNGMAFDRIRERRDQRPADTRVRTMGPPRSRYTATVGRFSDGRVGEIFLNNHKSNSAADVNAMDAAIVFSIAIQYGADIETVRRALCRDSLGRASGPPFAALDRLREQ